MQTDQFINRLSELRPDYDYNTLHAATLATLQGLCDHLPAEEARRMLSQLPREMADPIVLTPNHSETWQADRFYADIAERAGLTASEAGACAHAVGRVMRQAITPGELVDVVFLLPKGLDTLLS